ncbi:MAG: DUF2334 domain-containing protein [bacterium]
MKFEKIKEQESYRQLTAQVQSDGFAVTLSKILDLAESLHQKPISLFFRDDDVDVLTSNLVNLVHLFTEKDIPLHLQIIPNNLEVETVRYLKKIKRNYPHRILLSQHGWSHANHNPDGRKHEFGDERSASQQFSDIISGKEVLTKTFLNDFLLAFTPPWNRYNSDTVQVLTKLGFQILSADGGTVGELEGELVEISTAIDLHHQRPHPTLKSPVHLLFELRENLKKNHQVGWLLHHHEMSLTDLHFLNKFVALLQFHEVTKFPTFLEIYHEIHNPEYSGRDAAKNEESFSYK